MGCLKSKPLLLRDECYCDLTYTVPRKRSHSFDISQYINQPRSNENKLLQLKHLSSSLQMEAELLEDLNKRMPRYSTADHDLSQFEGLSDNQDICSNYAEFKMDLITYQPLRLQFVAGIPEAIAGQTTPNGFPGFTKLYNNPKEIPIYATVNKNMKRRRLKEEIVVESTFKRVSVKAFDLPQLHKVESRERKCDKGC